MTVFLDTSYFIALMQASDQWHKAAVEADPAMAGAHELWGALVVNRGDLDGALRELEAAVKIAPGFAKAQYEIGVVLYSKGDSNGAVGHLRLAANGGYGEAAQFLKKIGK